MTETRKRLAEVERLLPIETRPNVDEIRDRCDAIEYLTDEVSDGE